MHAAKKFLRVYVVCVYTFSKSEWKKKNGYRNKVLRCWVISSNYCGHLTVKKYKFVQQLHKKSATSTTSIEKSWLLLKVTVFERYYEGWSSNGTYKWSRDKQQVGGEGEHKLLVIVYWWKQITRCKDWLKLSLLFRKTKRKHVEYRYSNPSL